MNHKILVVVSILTLTLVLFGCQNIKNNNSANTWGNNNNISTEDISEIKIQNKKDSARSLTQQEIKVFMNAINNGVYNQGKLDIRPPDYEVEMSLKSGESKKLFLWIDDGGDLFMDEDESGHYILNETDRTELKVIFK